MAQRSQPARNAFFWLPKGALWVGGSWLKRSTISFCQVLSIVYTQTGVDSSCRAWGGHSTNLVKKTRILLMNSTLQIGPTLNEQYLKSFHFLVTMSLNILVVKIAVSYFLNSFLMFFIITVGWYCYHLYHWRWRINCTKAHAVGWADS